MPNRKEHLQFSNNPWEQMEFNRLPNSLKQLIKLTNKRAKKAKQKPKTDILAMYQQDPETVIEKFKPNREQLALMNEISEKSEDDKKKDDSPKISFQKTKLNKNDLYHKMIYGFESKKDK